MAGEWIKMRCDLGSDPTVIALATQFGLDEDAVVGKLHRFWSWCSLHLRDGDAPSVTPAWLDRFVGVAGFAEVLCREGWIEPVGSGFRVINYDRHMSTNAKKRALTSARTKRWRDAERDADVTHRASPREEKRRDKKKTSLISGFSEFWAAYPRKVDKADAEKAWGKLQPDDAMRADIMAALAWQGPLFLRRIAQGEREYVPHAATWLNKRRWQDERESAAGETPPASERPFVC